MTDIFSSLVQQTTTIAKQQKNTIPAWEGAIPAGAIALVEQALQNPTDRVLFPCTDVEQAIQIHSGLNAAVAKVAPEKQIHTRHVFNKDTKAMEKFGFSIGEKRGRKSAATS